MKKKIILSLMVASLFACKDNMSPQSRSSRYSFVIQDTLLYTKTIDSVPSLKPFMPALRSHIPEYLAYAKYLSPDSAKGLHIDFVGMVHTPLFGDGPVDDITQCQDEIYRLFPTYDYLGCEALTGFGVITKDEFIQQQIGQFKTFYATMIDTSLVTKQSIETAMHAEVGTSAIIRHLLSSPVANTIAADDLLTGNIQELIMREGEQDMRNRAFFMAMNGYFTTLRSELAVAKTVAFIRRHNLQQKKVLVVYGSLHMPQFKDISRRIGLVSSFIVPKPCEAKYK